jgi:CHAD domain-containing protein
MTEARASATFACTPELTLADLLDRLLSIGELHGPVEARADETYLDTRGDELAAAGLTARCREHAGLRIIQLVVVPIDPDELPEVPTLERACAREEDLGVAVRAWVRSRFGLELSEPPREVLSLVITRRRWSLLADGGRAEIALDEIAGSEPHGRRVRLSEVSVQCDREPTMRRVLAALRKVDGLAPAKATTFERTREALGLAEPGYGSKPAVLAGDDLLVDAARRVVASWWATVRAHIPGVRVGIDPEHVHKLRVALRRLRTALKLFDDAFDPAALARLRESTRSLGRAFGAVRDLDVQRGAIVKWRERFAMVEPDAWRDITDRIDRERDAARRVALALLDGERWQELCSDVERCLAPDHRGLRHTVGAVAPVLVRKRADRCARALERVEDGGAAEAHALRIEVKNLRYSLDFLAYALAVDDEIVARLAKVQSVLGEVQDDVQAGELAQRLAAMAPRPTSGAALGLGVLVGYGRARSDNAPAAAQQAASAHGLVELLGTLVRPE